MNGGHIGATDRRPVACNVPRCSQQPRARQAPGWLHRVAAMPSLANKVAVRPARQIELITHSLFVKKGSHCVARFRFNNQNPLAAKKLIAM